MASDRVNSHPKTRLGPHKADSYRSVSLLSDVSFKLLERLIGYSNRLRPVLESYITVEEADWRPCTRFNKEREK